MPNYGKPFIAAEKAWFSKMSGCMLVLVLAKNLV